MFRKIGPRLMNAPQLNSARMARQVLSSATRTLVDTLRVAGCGFTRSYYNPLEAGICEDTRKYVDLMDKVKTTETKKIAAMMPLSQTVPNLQLQLRKRKDNERHHVRVMSLVQRMQLQNSIFNGGGGVACLYPKRDAQLARQIRVETAARTSHMNKTKSRTARNAIKKAHRS